MKNFACLFTFSLSFILLSCSSTPSTHPQLSELRNGSFVFFFYRLEASPFKKTCLLELEHIQTTQIYRIPIDVKKQSALERVAPGRYKFNVLDCGMGYAYKIESPFGKKKNEFLVPRNRASYLGSTRFVFQKGKQLVLKFDQTQHIKMLRSHWGEFSDWGKKNMSSAYTGRIIDASYLKTPADRKYSLKSKAPQSEKAALQNQLKWLKKKIQRCAETEVTVNPLRLGSLKIDVKYNKGRLQKLKRSQKEQHIYTDNFARCAEASLRQMPVDTQYPFEIALEL